MPSELTVSTINKIVEVPDRNRIVAIDLFRAIAIGGMVLVNNNGGQGAYSQLRHSAWHGVTFADLVFPFFLWIAGVSAVLSCDRRLTQGADRREVFLHAARRSALLIVLGLFLAGFPRFDLTHLRVMGVLQRIGICTVIAAAVHLYASRRVRRLSLVGSLAAYTVLMHPGGYERGANLSNRIDAAVLGSHNAPDTATWDTEGILSTLPALATCLLGASAGRRIGQAGELRWLLNRGAFLVAAGWVVSVWQPFNKSIWTSSYALFTAGFACLALAALRILVHTPRGWTRPWETLGRYALPVYVFHDFFATLLRRLSLGGVSLDERLRGVWISVLDPGSALLGYAMTHLAASLVLALSLSWIQRWRRSSTP